MTKKKIVLFAPINDFGGINLDVGFISSILKNSHEVKVVSLANYYSNSQIYHFDKNLDYNSLNRIIYKANLLYKIIVSIICFFKPVNVPNHFRVGDIFKKLPLTHFKKAPLRFLKSIIKDADYVFICSQLTAKFNRELIEFSSQLNKPVIFKTTGQINLSNIDDSYIDLLKHVSLFINHSKRNSSLLQSVLPSCNNVIIDQNAYLEKELLNISPKNNITRFFTLSRLHSVKKIDMVVKTFLKMNNPKISLNIYGDGEDMKKLRELAKSNPNIKFHGNIAYNDLGDVFRQNDCLIIASSVEAGPYTGIESMASATPIISTRVGAMEQRLGVDYTYFFDGSINGLEKKIEEKIGLEKNEVLAISEKLRETYVKNYAEETIRNAYTNAFNRVIL